MAAEERRFPDTFTVATAEHNRDKNRYRDVLAKDQTRVRLRYAVKK